MSFCGSENGDDHSALGDCALQPCSNCDCPLARQNLRSTTTTTASNTAATNTAQLRRRSSAASRPLEIALDDLSLSPAPSLNTAHQHNNSQHMSKRGASCPFEIGHNQKQSGASDGTNRCSVRHHQPLHPPSPLPIVFVPGKTPPPPKFFPTTSASSSVSSSAATSASSSSSASTDDIALASRPQQLSAPQQALSSMSIDVDATALERHPECDACPECDDVCPHQSCSACRVKATNIEKRMCKQRHRGCHKRVFTMCQVRRHNREDDCWLVAHRKVYDVTSFVQHEFHRAGMHTIVRKAGTDVTRDFDFHSPRARKQLWGHYLIGVQARFVLFCFVLFCFVLFCFLCVCVCLSVSVCLCVNPLDCSCIALCPFIPPPTLAPLPLSSLSTSLVFASSLQQVSFRIPPQRGLVWQCKVCAEEAVPSRLVISQRAALCVRALCAHFVCSALDASLDNFLLLVLVLVLLF